MICDCSTKGEKNIGFPYKSEQRFIKFKADIMNDAKGRKENDINDESVAHFVQRKKNEREENFRF